MLHLASSSNFEKFEHLTFRSAARIPYLTIYLIVYVTSTAPGAHATQHGRPTLNYARDELL